MDAEKLGLFIAGIRKEKNMTQADLAQKLNVTVQAVSKWDRGGPTVKDITLQPTLIIRLKIIWMRDTN